jgi:hypothetical protein
MIMDDPDLVYRGCYWLNGELHELEQAFTSTPYAILVIEEK